MGTDRTFKAAMNLPESSRKAAIKRCAVAIVGNGPSAICLSFMLSGWTPYYLASEDGDADDLLNAKLAAFPKTPLTDMDLEYLCEGLEGRSSSPLGLLYDCLAHPAADLGAHEKPRIRWVYQPERAVSHVVLGSGRPGGSWQSMNKDMLTLSRCDFIELPNMPFLKWHSEEGSKKSPAPTAIHSPYRVTAGDVCKYYEDYIKRHGLESKFISGYHVESAFQVPDPQGQSCLHNRGNCLWEVRGRHQGATEAVTVLAKFLVLANGACDLPAKLHTPWENCDYVHRSLSSLENLIADGKLNSESDPVLIVGSGISAADAIFTARRANVRVVHVFRRSSTDRNIVYSTLPKRAYPEYDALTAMIKGDRMEERYVCFPSSRVKSFGHDGRVVIESNGKEVDSVLTVSLAMVLIGATPNLSFMPTHGLNLGIEKGNAVDGRRNPVAVDPFSYQSAHIPTLFAMGPVAGDHFVRFLQGAALGITQTILQYKSNRRHAALRELRPPITAVAAL